MLSDLRFALRQLRRAPGFALVVVACLALGVGVNVALFGVVDALLLRPPAGVRAPGELRRVQVVPVERPGQQVIFAPGLSPEDARALAARRDAFRAVGVWADGAPTLLGEGDAAREVHVTAVNGQYFAALGARPALGRLLGPGDDTPSAAPAVVMGHGLWAAAFGADPRVVGRRVRVDGRWFTVVGVAERRFAGLGLRAPELWVPLARAADAGFPAAMARGATIRWLSAAVRLADGAPEARAAATAAAALAAADAAAPAPAPELVRREVTLRPVNDRVSGAGGLERSPVPLWLFGATAAVLLVACANVANLLLARAEPRRREIATRVAVGAARGRVVRQLLVESAVLAALGGALGLALADALVALARLTRAMPRVEHAVDVRAALFALAVASLTTLAFGLAPALAATRAGVGATLVSGGRSTPRRSRLRGALTVAQLALSLALVAVAGLFVRSLRNAQRVDVGFALERVLVVQPDVARAVRDADARPGRGRGPGAADEVLARAAERLRRVPGVEAVGVAAAAPLDGVMIEPVRVPGREVELDAVPGSGFTTAADTAYFRALGIPILRGRAFDARDVAGAPEAVVVSETFARRVWPAGDALGKCVVVAREGGACATVVGVARDVRFVGLQGPVPPLLYRAAAQRGVGGHARLVVRTARPAALAADARAAVRTVDGVRAATAYALVDGSVAQQLGPFRLGAAAFSLFGVLALLLAAVGLYGVVAFLVAQRTNELGIRLALGATRRTVIALVLRQGLRFTAAGAALGVAAGLGAARLLASRLYGVSATDPLVFGAVLALLAVVALLACWLPARRAAAVDPVRALRAE